MLEKYLPDLLTPEPFLCHAFQKTTLPENALKNIGLGKRGLMWLDTGCSLEHLLLLGLTSAGCLMCHLCSGLPIAQPFPMMGSSPLELLGFFCAFYGTFCSSAAAGNISCFLAWLTRIYPPRWGLVFSRELLWLLGPVQSFLCSLKPSLWGFLLFVLIAQQECLLPSLLAILDWVFQENPAFLPFTSLPGAVAHRGTQQCFQSFIGSFCQCQWVSIVGQALN